MMAAGLLYGILCKALILLCSFHLPSSLTSLFLVSALFLLAKQPQRNCKDICRGIVKVQRTPEVLGEEKISWRREQSNILLHELVFTLNTLKAHEKMAPGTGQIDCFMGGMARSMVSISLSSWKGSACQPQKDA